MRLTAAGAAFLDTAYRTLAELEQGIEYARNVSAGVSGKLTITAISIAYYDSLLNRLRRFRETYPNVQLTIREMPSASQAKALLAGEADIGFMRRLPLPVGTLEARLLLDEQIVMALPASHPMARFEAVDLREFADEDFVFTRKRWAGATTHSWLRCASRPGSTPRSCRRRRRSTPCWVWWPAALAWPWCRLSFVRSTPRERVQFCPIRPIDDQPPPGLGLYMKWNAQNASPALANFIAMFETQQ